MKSVLVIGLGRFGRHLANQMLTLGNDVMIVDRDAALVEQYATTFTDAQIGDCTNREVIRALGVNHFDICFVAIGSDFQSSLVITSLLKQFDAKYIVSKAKQDIQAELLKKIGAAEVVYPEKEIAEKVAVRYNAKNIFDYIPLTGAYSIYEIPVLPAWVGSSVGQLDIRRKYRVNIVAIKQGENLQPTPDAEYLFNAQDHLVLIGTAEDVFKLAAKT